MITVNIATPETPSELKLVTDFVAAHPQIKVSGAYHGVVESMSETSHWHRPGFDFKFWFDDEDTARQFISTTSPFTNAKIEIA